MKDSDVIAQIANLEILVAQLERIVEKQGIDIRNLQRRLPEDDHK